MKHQHFYFILSFFLFILLFAAFPEYSWSQNETRSKKALTVGIGNYEYVFAGMHLPLKHRYYFETSLGLKPWKINERYLMGYFCFGGRFLKEKKQRN